MGENGVDLEKTTDSNKLIEKIRAHEAYAAKVKGAYSELSTMYNKLRDDYAAFVNKHNDVTKKLEETRVKNEERITELEATVDEMKVAHREAEEEFRKELEQTKAESDGNIQAVKKDLERASELNLEMMKSNGTVDEVRDELEEMRAAKGELEEKCDQQENDLRNAKDELWSMILEIEGITEDSSEGSGEDVSGGSDKVEDEDAEDAISVPTDLDEMITKLGELRIALRKKFEDLKESKTSAETNVLRLTEEKTGLEQVLTHKEDADELLKMLVTAKTDFAESESCRLKLQGELTQLRRKLVQ